MRLAALVSPLPAAARRTMRRWALFGTTVFAAALGCGFWPGPLQAAPAAAPSAPAAPKVLRYALRVAETGFDPAKISDLYSLAVTAHVFEGLYGYDHLARPVRIKPLTAVALPETSADFRTFTIRIRPGIRFADDPAFKGQPRYTLRLETREPRPRLIELLAGGDHFGAVAREVVEAYGDQIEAHPVGTGPFKLVQWRRSSLIVLERNPHYRERTYDAEPAADDAVGQALLARFKGRRLPMLDRVEVSIIEEPQPRWLSFLNRQQNFIERVPEEFITVAMPGNQLVPNLAKQGIQGLRTLAADAIMTLYNMEDPVVGGYTPDKIALRRAINLSMDIQREIDLVRRGQGIPAQGMNVPHTTGYDPAYRSEMGDYDPARARALLDLYGYVDRDGDGWRDLPDGRPLVLRRSSQPDQQSRALDDLWVRDMRAVGLKGEIVTAKWPENLKATRAGKLMMWWLGSSASQLDGQSALTRLYGPQAGMGNLARFHNAELDALYMKMQVLPDGPQREAMFREAKRIATVYAPYKNHLHRYITDMSQPEVVGYRRPVFWQNWWEYLDIDNGRP
jgi:ABC-type transport system substrate-binding protein